MQSKLTLRLDERLIENAKQQARARGTSVSALVSGYFAALGDTGEPQALTPTVRRLRGVLRDASASRETYRNHLQEKHKI
jgi:hypothetical protein